jgi:hypothetical protein
MTWSVDAVPSLTGYTVEWVEPGRVLLSRKNRIYQAASPTAERQLLGEVTAASWKRVAANVRLGQRVARFMVYNALPLADGSVFVTFDKQLGIIKQGKYQPLEGLARPFRVLRGACAIGRDGAVYFGEYLDNAARGAMNVYRCAPGSHRAEVAHTFDAGQVRHIHGVYADPYTDALWCVTGDGAEESRVTRTFDSFRTLEVVGAGDESWRTVSLLFTEDAIFYASDAEFNENHIYRLDRKTGERAVLGEIDGPVYYSHAIGRDLFFAVTAELCPSQKQPAATLWHVTRDGGIERIYSAAKDLVHKQIWNALFMHGTMHFPSGPGAGRETYIHGVSLRGIDNRTLRLYHNEQNGA